jgi:PPP family 3-phenylpropionic acid transporter
LTALPRFVALYALMYAAFGVSSPFMPAFFQARGLSPEQLGIVFSAGTAIRLVAGPVAGRLADVTQARRALLASCQVLAAVVALGLFSAPVFVPLLVTSLLHAAALAPTTTLADALAVDAAQPREARPRFEYGWVRGTGSAALVPAADGEHPVTARHDMARVGFRTLLGLPVFRRVMLVSALVLGSHAMHDTFAVIRWRAAGVTPSMASALWSASVAAEVLVFFLIGPPLLRRLGPPSVIAIAAAAGVVRWLAMASSASVVVLAFMQPLHGLTFAALHLACMRVVADIVPRHLAATAQAMYALGAGVTTALLTLTSGWLYAELGAYGFVAMAVLCAAAIPLTPGLRLTR